MASKKPVVEETVKERRLSEEIIEQMTKLSSAGFGLVAALAWNNAIQDFFDTYVKEFLHGDTVYYKFLYAILITLLVVIVTYQLSRLSARIQGFKKD